MELLPPHVREMLDELAHELDMVVYRLERPEPDGEAARLRERVELRLELERLRRRVLDQTR